MELAEGSVLHVGFAGQLLSGEGAEIGQRVHLGVGDLLRFGEGNRNEGTVLSALLLFLWCLYLCALFAINCLDGHQK